MSGKRRALGLLVDEVRTLRGSNPPREMRPTRAPAEPDPIRLPHEPLPAGAAPDRSEGTLPRYEPRLDADGRQTRGGEPTRVQALIDQLADPNSRASREIADSISQGERVGREWYNTERVRDRFIRAYDGDEEAGDRAWREFMVYVGATSPRMRVQGNIRAASRAYVHADDIAAGRVSPVPERGSGYGGLAGGTHAPLIREHLTGRYLDNPDPTFSPKTRGFAQGLLGNPNNIAADVHFMRLLGMTSRDPRFLNSSAEVGDDLAALLEADPRLSDFVRQAKVDGVAENRFNARAAAEATGERRSPVFRMAQKDAPTLWEQRPTTAEYSLVERLAQTLGRRHDMTAPQIQASMWVGGGPRTGVRTPHRATFADIFDQNLEQRAAERGSSADDVFMDFVRRLRPLAVPGAAGAGAGLLGDE